MDLKSIQSRFESGYQYHAEVVQLVEALDLGSSCCEFESHLRYHYVECSSVGRAMGCDPIGHRFESGRSSQIQSFRCAGIYVGRHTNRVRSSACLISNANPPHNLFVD